MFGSSYFTMRRVVAIRAGTPSEEVIMGENPSMTIFRAQVFYANNLNVCFSVDWNAKDSRKNYKFFLLSDRIEHLVPLK